MGAHPSVQIGNCSSLWITACCKYWHPDMPWWLCWSRKSPHQGCWNPFSDPFVRQRPWICPWPTWWSWNRSYLSSPVINSKETSPLYQVNRLVVQITCRLSHFLISFSHLMYQHDNCRLPVSQITWILVVLDGKSNNGGTEYEGTLKFSEKKVII